MSDGEAEQVNAYLTPLCFSSGLQEDRKRVIHSH